MNNHTLSLSFSSFLSCLVSNYFADISTVNSCLFPGALSLLLQGHSASHITSKNKQKKDEMWKWNQNLFFSEIMASRP